MADDPITELLAIMAALRDPKTGCPWDKIQNFKSIAPYTIEEAYEVAEAIERGDMADLRDELGDLLLQVVFHAQMASELVDKAGAFDFNDVVTAINAKMTRRHPHVFGDGKASNTDEVRQTWEQIKAQEKLEKASEDADDEGLLDDIPASMPALMRAVKLQKRAAKAGFDWPDTGPVLDKLAEEVCELKAAHDAGEPPARLADELGDILFVLANLARHMKLDPESALRGANTKFIRRFEYIEQQLKARALTPEQSTLEEMDGLWDEAKKQGL